jgi:ATP-dependent DNA helicase DinG
MDYLSQVFGPGGLFASRFPGYESRPAQLELARQIDRAIVGRTHLLGEAPTGTGKSAAQCVPAIYHAVHSERRVVIVTENIALQEQLMRKDLPLLRDLLPWPFRFAVLKGKQNYACVDKLVQIRSRARDLFGDARLDAETGRVLDWARATNTGDVSDLAFTPSSRLWGDVSVTSETCQGATCPSLRDCFVERARVEAQNAHVVVTNYHLLGAHLAARLETGQDCILPPHDVLILDEAHAAADILRECLGFKIVRRDLDEMVQLSRQLGQPELAGAIEGPQLLDYLGARARASNARSAPVRAGADVAGDGIAAALDAVARLAERRGEEVLGDSRAGWQRLARKATTLATRVAEATACSDRNKAYWVELDDQGRVSLMARPIHIAPILNWALFGMTPTVVALSATLTTDGNFGFIRRELGVPAVADELTVESPFDFARQGFLVIPDGLPEPNAPEFPDACAEVFSEVIERCNGRTLGLFTSYRNLNAVYERLDRSKHRVLKQGDLPRSELVRIFKEDVHSVLLGTESFWTGIDIPGPSCTAVVIDKLPFPRPDDPIVSALADRDANGFVTQLLPRAVIELKQGVGRLIRTSSDVGAVVICDRRLIDKRYGEAVLRSLPPMMKSRRLSSISAFLAEEEEHAAALPR